jgi:hypothetical protein
LTRFYAFALFFENKTIAGSSDNVVQLAKAHSLHTLFAVFEKNEEFYHIPQIF